MKKLLPFLVVLAILLLLLGGYVGAYLGMGRRIDVWESDSPKSPLLRLLRQYDYEWSVTVFKPAAQAESKLRGIEVIIYSRSVKNP